MVFGVYGRPCAVGDANLVEDVADVTVHGVDADYQRVRDLVVALAIRDEPQDLHLARRESSRRLRRRRLRLDLREEAVEDSEALPSVSVPVLAIDQGEARVGRH